MVYGLTQIDIFCYLNLFNEKNNQNLHPVIQKVFTDRSDVIIQ